MSEEEPAAVSSDAKEDGKAEDATDAPKEKEEVKGEKEEEVQEEKEEEVQEEKEEEVKEENTDKTTNGDAPPMSHAEDKIAESDDEGPTDEEVAEIQRNASGGTDPSDIEEEPPAAKTNTTILIEEESDDQPHLFPPVDNRARATSHSKMRAYEAKRRAAYKQKLASSSLYWRSFRDLLNASVEETERAESIVKGQAVANEAYAVAMAAAYEDTFDDDGKPVTDPKKKKKLFETRMKKRAAGSTKMLSLSEAAGAIMSSRQTTDGTSNAGAALSDLSSIEQASERRGSLLASVIESHSILADRYDEHSTFLREEIIPPLFQLCENLIVEVETIEKLGDAIIDELTAAEKEVADAWEDYYKTAVKSLGGEGSSASHRKGASSTKDGPALVENSKDVWIAEMHYRMSVAFLSACWEKCSSELSKLFSSMKEIECTRRFRLREILLTFLERQERLWLGLPSVLTPVLKGLTDKPMDRSSIENDVQSSIRLRAQNLQREDVERKSKGGHGPGPGLAGVDPGDGNFELTSPLMSDLLFKAKVIEKKGHGMMTSWKTTLAVVTADSFLHLFDMPTTVKFHSGSAPEVAFHALLPPVIVPTKETIAKHGYPKISVPKAWCQNLTPTESIVLPNSTISFQDEKGNSAFEITETVFNSGTARKFFTTSTKKMYLRTVTREETIDWIAALKAHK